MFNELIVGYLFLAGVGAGACFVLSVLALLIPRPYLVPPSQRRIVISASYRSFFLVPIAIAVALLVLGMVCLCADLGHVDRLILLLTRPRLSYVTVGAYSLAACVLLAGAAFTVWQQIWRPSFAVFRVLSALLVLASLVTMAYTGLFLSSMHSVPLWSTLWVPILFVLSSISCGIALVLLVFHAASAGSNFTQVVGRLVRFDALLIVFEVAVVVLYCFSAVEVLESAMVFAQPEGPTLATLSLLTNTDLAFLESFWALVFGDYSLMFWAFLLVVGLIVPFAFDLICSRSRRVHRGLIMSASICVLIGGYALRHCIVLAGVRPALVMVGVM